MKELFDGEYAIPEGYTASIENGKVIVKKEESDDEKIRKWIINEIKIKHHNLDEANVDFVDKAIAWLEKQGEQKPTDEEMKILLQTEYEKGRADAIEQKSDWSEEDEGNFSQLHKLIVEKAYLDYEIDTDDETLYGKWLKLDNWLNSIKERYTWKPSDEQMAALSNINVTGYISYAGQGQELINLYKELKKLKA